MIFYFNRYKSQDFTHGNVTEYDSHSGVILGDCIGRKATNKGNALNGIHDEKLKEYVTKLPKKENVSAILTMPVLPGPCQLLKNIVMCFLVELM